MPEEGGVVEPTHFELTAEQIEQLASGRPGHSIGVSFVLNALLSLLLHIA